MVEKFSMPKLRFVCCGWEALGGRGFYKFNDYSMGVTMYSSESLIMDRNHWAEIPKFIVEVTLYLEQP